MADMESSNKKHLIQINELLNEKAEWQLAMSTVSTELKEGRNTTILDAAKLKKDEENECLKAEVAHSFNDAKVALINVIETSKGWAMKAFNMLVEPEDFDRFESHLLFQEEVHKA